MKRIILPLFVVILIGLILILSCRKNATLKTEEKLSTVNTIYERSNPAEIDTSMWADHIIMIEEITRNDGSLDKYKLDYTWLQYVAQNIDTSKPIWRYTYDNSSTQLITIPLLTSHRREAALVYASRDTFMFASCTIDSLTNSNLKYVFKPVGVADFYYSFEVDTADYIGNIALGIHMPLDDILGNRSGPSCRDAYPRSFINCMNCSLNLCWDRWWCKFIPLTSTIGIGQAGGWVLGCGAP